MTSRIERTFEGLRRNGRGGLVAYVTAGDPDPSASIEILEQLGRHGADVLEVGVPFSDPVADGPVIQRASERALAKGMTLAGALEMVKEFRRRSDTPVVLFTYANPVLRMDASTFARSARDAGVDGVLILDYPVEESALLRQTMVDAALDPIFLVSPTTTDERIRKTAALGRGFLYVISRLGVTGTDKVMSNGTSALLARVKSQTRLPVAIGFGISTPEHVAEACRHADAAVVGSALVNVIADSRPSDAPARAGEFVRWLKSAL